MPTDEETILLVQHHLNPLAARFWHPEWEPRTGVNFSTPEMTAEKQAAHGDPIDARWEVWVEKWVQNSRNLSDTGRRGSAFAALRFESVDDLLGSPIELIAYQLAQTMAGRRRTRRSNGFGWTRNS